MGTTLSREGTNPQCRITTLHQSDIGVLTLRCMLGAELPDDRDSAELIFVSRDEHSERTYPLRHIRRNGSTALEARIRLCDMNRPLLQPGVWDVCVRLGESGPLLPLTAPSHGTGTWPPIMVPAPGGPYAVSPAVQRDTITLQVDRTTEYCEVDRVEIEGSALIVDAHLVPEGPVAGRDGQLIALSRDGKDVAVRVPVTLSCGRLHTVVDIDELLSDDRQNWDLYLRLGEGRILRLGSHLDEIHNKNSVFSFPHYTVDRSGKTYAAQPFYTVDNNLSVRTWPVNRKPQVGARGVPQAKSLPVRRWLRRPAKPLMGLVVSTVELIGRLRRPYGATGTGPRKVYFMMDNAFGVTGLHRTILNLANHLARDHDVEIISLVRRQRRPFFEIDERVRLTFLLDEVAPRNERRRGLARRLQQVLHSKATWLVHENDFMNKKHSLWLDLKQLQRLHTMEPGILIATHVSFNVIAARFARSGVVTIGEEHKNFTVRKPLLKQIRRHYRKLDALAVLTVGDERDFGELLAGSNTRVIRISNPLPEEPVVRADLDRKQVIAAGNYMLPKGFDLLVRAFEEVVHRHPDWQLRVYGDGPQNARLQRQARAAKLHNHVLFMGRTDQLNEEFARSSIFVLSSREEGFGMVIIEAMAVGLPVVSFDCPRGPSDIITDGVDGTLVPAKDTDALAMAILDLIENPDKRRAYSAAALRTVKSYESDAIAQIWRRTFDELIG